MIKINKRKTLKKAKQIGKGLTEVLLEILSLMDDAYTYLLFDHYHQRYPKSFNYKPQIYSTLSRLDKQGFIKARKVGKRTYYQLTQTGRARLLIKQVFKDKINPKDGLSTMIIFDIPEEKKKARIFLRRLLLKNGFINLQKSVMIAPYELSKEFLELLSEMKIRQHVVLLKSKIIHF